MQMTLDDAERAQRQRDFYIKLMPQGGQMIAAQIGGFTPPGLDSQERELLSALRLWMQVHHAGAFETLADASWWMTRFQDQQGRLNRAQAHNNSDELIAYAVACIGQLLDKGIITWKSDPGVPELVVDSESSFSGQKLDEVDRAVLDRLDDSTWDDD